MTEDPGADEEGWEEPAESTLDPGALEGEGRGTPSNELEGEAPDQLGDRLGRGAGGVVLRGRDRHLPRHVAWKVARGPRAKARLAHEARVLAALEHPAIVPIYDLVEGPDDSLRIALRMVRGETLHTLVRRAPDLAGRLRLLRPFVQAVEAVAWAHRVGWVHRDLKPANIMIGELGETQVIDWGLAENLDEPTYAPGEVAGTLGLMSPEQARGEAVATTFDVWGLGATLFELLAGRSLYPSRDELPGGLEALLERVRRGQRPSLSEACPDAPRELIAIVERCLAIAPEARYPDARALALDLGAFLDGRQVAAHDYSAIELLRRFVRAWRLPLGVALAVLVTAAIATGVAFDRIGDERDEALRATEQARAALAARDQQIAQGGVIEARRELAADQRPEAELAAARTLAVGESPEARGVVMAFGRAPRPTRGWARALPFDCVDLRLAPDGRHTLCSTRDALVMLEESTPVWSSARPHRGAVFIANGAIVLVAQPDGTHVALDAVTGQTVRTFPATACLGELATDRRQALAMNLGHACLSTFSALGMVVHTPCSGQHVEVAAIDAVAGGVRVASLCVGGDLEVIGPDGVARRRPTPIGEAADMQLTAAFFGADALVVGSSRGDLTVLDLETGAIRARHTLAAGNAIRDIAVSPELGRLVITAEGAGPILAAMSTLAPLATLPRSEVAVARFDAGLPGAPLVTHGEGLSGWALPPGPPAWLEGLGGVTSAQDDGEHLVVTHDASALVLDPRDGRVEAHATWDKVIAKHAVLEGDTLGVAIAGRIGGEVLRSSGSATRPAIEVEELAAMRRVWGLSGGRRLGSRTGLGFVLWPAPGSSWVKIEDRLVTDLSVRDDLAAVLYDSPREIVLYDVRAAPVELGRCAVPSATSVALAGRGLVDPEPTVLAVTPSAILAYRAHDTPARGASSPECPIVALYGARGSELTRAIVSHDGRYVAGGTRDGTVHVWHAGGALVASAPVHESTVTTLSVDPADRWFVSGAWDGRVSFLALDVLDAPRASLVAAIRSAWGGPASAR